MLIELGLVGDQQVEKKIYGGFDCVLCYYFCEYYVDWICQFFEQVMLFCVLVFGENLLMNGMIEYNVFIGDIYCWGEVLIQVIQLCFLCFKFNFYFVISDMVFFMQNSGKIGWLYWVIVSGKVFSDVLLELVLCLSDVLVYEVGVIVWFMLFDDE